MKSFPIRGRGLIASNWYSLLAIIALFLFIFVSARLGLDSLTKELWADETAGSENYYLKDYQRLLWTGVSEASPSPLYYIVSRFWLSLWDFRAHEYWNLRLFQRAPSIVFWALSTVTIFLWAVGIFKRLYGRRSWCILLISLGVALFAQSNPFASQYAIEDRAYSLWLFLTLVQGLLIFDASLFGRTKSITALYGIISILLVFVTFSSFAITLIQLFLFWWLKERSFRFFYFSVILTFVCLLIVAWYFRSIPPMDYGNEWFTWKNYRGSVVTAFGKTFHHESNYSLLLSFPTLCLLVGYSAIRNLASRLLLAQVILLILLSIVLFKASEWKGGLWAPRYVIYLIPSALLFYFHGLWTMGSLLNTRIFKYKEHQLSKSIFLVWSIFQIVQFGNPVSLINSLKGISASPQWVYGKTRNIECPLKISDFSPRAVEQINTICRNGP
jgi:hypothetical protein